MITKVWSKYYVELTFHKNVFFDNQIWSSCICTCETKIEIGIAMHEMFVSHVVVQKLSLTVCKIFTEIHIFVGQNITWNLRQIKTFSLINKIWSKYYVELTFHKNHKGSGSLPVPRSGHATAIMFFLIFLSCHTQITTEI